MERADIDWSLTSPKMLRERIFDRLPSMPADELKIVLTDFCLIGSALPERKAVKAVKAVSSKRSSEDTTTNVFGGIGSSLREPFCPPSPPTSSRTTHRLLSHRRRAFRMQKRSKRSKRSYEKGSAVWLTHHSKSLGTQHRSLPDGLVQKPSLKIRLQQVAEAAIRKFASAWRVTIATPLDAAEAVRYRRWTCSHCNHMVGGAWHHLPNMAGDAWHHLLNITWSVVHGTTFLTWSVTHGTTYLTRQVAHGTTFLT